MTLKCHWCDEEITSNLKFQAPLKSVMRLHTALYKKFLQVTVTGLTSQKLMITSSELSATDTDLPLIKSLNSSKGQPQVNIHISKEKLIDFQLMFLNFFHRL